jgi:hypothetical protein
VFTARYALSPCIKQIRFVFKGLILHVHMQKPGLLGRGVRILAERPSYRGMIAGRDRPGLGPPCLPFVDVGFFARGWRQLGREADNLILMPSLRINRAITTLPPYAFISRIYLLRTFTKLSFQAVLSLLNFRLKFCTNLLSLRAARRALLFVTCID